MAVLDKGTIDNGSGALGAVDSTADVHRFLWYCRHPYPEYTIAVVLQKHLTGCTITVRDRNLNVITTGTAFFDNSWTSGNPVQYRYGVKLSRNSIVYPYTIFPSTTASLPCYVDVAFTGTISNPLDPGQYAIYLDQSGKTVLLPWEGSSIDAHPDSIHTNHTLTNGGTLYGSIGAPQDLDGFNVNLTAGRKVDISVVSSTNRPLYAKLYNRTTGAILNEAGVISTASGTGKFTLTHPAASTGMYYLRVFDDASILASASGPVGYTVMVRDYVAPAAPPPPPPPPSPVLTQPPVTTTTTTTTTTVPSTSGGTASSSGSSGGVPVGTSLAMASGYNTPMFNVGGTSISASLLMANLQNGYFIYGPDGKITISSGGTRPRPSSQPAAVTTSSTVTVTTTYPARTPSSSPAPAQPSLPQYTLQRLASHGWKTHARSVDPLNAGEVIDYTVGDGAVGACVAIGLKGLDGQMISRFSHGLIADGQGIRIYEGGQVVRTIRSVFTGATKIRIYRHQDNTIAYVVTVGGETLIHTSEKMSDWPGKFPLYVYGYLYSSGDKITSAAFTAGEVQYARC